MPCVFSPHDESPGGAIKTQAPVPYDHSCWAQSGEAIGVSLLDAYGHNCWSRLPASRYCSLARLLSLSPSFNSHRGQYGPPDNMTEILGAAYTSVFEQQLPCRHGSCCWQQPVRPGASPTGVLGSPASSAASTQSAPAGGGRSAGHFPAHQANASPGFSLPWSSWPSPVTTSATRCAVPFADLATNSSARSQLASAFEVKGGKPTSWVSYKSSAPGSRRHNRTGNVMSRGTVAFSKSASDQKPSRSSTHRQRATRTASTGALIVAGGTRQRLSAPAGVVAATAQWSSHR